MKLSEWKLYSIYALGHILQGSPEADEKYLKILFKYLMGKEQYHAELMDYEEAHTQIRNSLFGICCGFHTVYAVHVCISVCRSLIIVSFVETISFDEILNLCNILYENPYFAAYTNIGKRVYQIIRDWPVSMTFDEPYYYRARIADSENELYLASDMMMPPEGIPSQGRYNEYGRSCFYFTNSLEGAVKEVAGHQGQRDKYVQIIQLK